MRCYIYRSKRHDQLYLFLQKQDDFAVVPENIRHYIGTMEYSMTLELDPQKKLARSNPADVMANLKQHGFHIQLPPSVNTTNDAVH